ncbi:hypothetical protein IQ283_13630 [Alkalihalobacillus hwajinpoensis]|uniref:hypothetical protein n=1 Tax=Guptibacillus hwajinpoensis TaxID=208199 RepID=UPI001883B173|nr:hypothetical protein [Pseudalkalibacillus hwajinpoensis]MBF0707633.1 hypothetical protein [Pseudalkalibacillus hwajinpoensis]
MTEIVLIGLLAAVFYLVFRVSTQMSSLSGRMKSMHNQLNRMAQHMDLPEHPINDELRELMKEGKTVEAVKKAREEFGLSLLEAKEYVDGI